MSSLRYTRQLAVSRRGVAQLVARIVRDDEVAGSNPVTPTMIQTVLESEQKKASVV